MDKCLCVWYKFPVGFLSWNHNQHPNRMNYGREIIDWTPYSSIGLLTELIVANQTVSKARNVAQHTPSHRYHWSWKLCQLYVVSSFARSHTKRLNVRHLVTFLGNWYLSVWNSKILFSFIENYSFFFEIFT